jgi:YrbI family 3-deoxy-D-manno-octulosonate 8-phosphate phosphatase
MPSTTRRTSTLSKPSVSLLRILRGIRLFATDVDGVLTDAGMYYSESGDEWKKFNTRDGMGIKLLQKAGIVTAIITQESTKIVMRRAQKLTIPEVHQGAYDKLAVLKDLIARHGLTMKQVAYIGDDVNDLQALGAVGFSASPADGMPPVLKVVRYVCKKNGGEGAVRELADLILAAQQPR